MDTVNVLKYVIGLSSGGQHGMFVNFGANFLKRVHPYGSKNIVPQPFHPKGPWV